ncbi:MAG TPA: NAD(P)H-quinone oxidoreductase [Mycobacteriales bacterium]|nr:NAD(P)H-quinone oxidoreductase [Mycobacteriales bacterium]
MLAIAMTGPGDVDVLSWRQVPDPKPEPGEVLLEVAASAVNRADLMQRQGFYPPPPGASELLGLECSGTVAGVGAGVVGLKVGDQVCALLAGGGYAERVVVPAGQCLPIPAGVDLISAAALPEVACTVHANLIMTARLQAGETLLIHGGGSGIGTFAIQYAVALGVRVAVTAGSDEKLQRCRELGAEVLINYREQDFVEVLGAADVILDNMGAKYLARNVTLLAPNGRLVVIGLQGGTTAELNLGELLGKRGTVHAASLRVRPAAEKAAICAEVLAQVWPLIAAGRIRPVIDRVLPMPEAAAAHRLVTESTHVGKVLLQVPRRAE